MTDAKISLDPDFRLGTVDRRLFGSFVEHMGRCVYTGIYEPGHPTADRTGFRTDVRDLVRELGPTAVRYPGGNFVSGYRWEDGVGPREQRPRRLDLAWRTVEPNQVGVDEFLHWCRGADIEPILAVNLGTRGVQDAVDLLEYCNHPGGTALSDQRRANGTVEPHDVRTWCLGNELDGPWQVGHKSAQEYGRLAAETARAMRMVDPDLELVACGSSNSKMPSFGAWEATVLEHCYELVDYISLHTYYDPLSLDRDSFLACAVDLDRMIESVVATADHVGARLRSRRRLRLSVDEWNVWYQSAFAGQDRLAYDRPDPALIEDVYDVTDAVVVGSLLIALINHADRVGIACQAQLVNVIAPIMTTPGGPAWRQTIFHPFAQAGRWARGVALRADPKVASMPTDAFGDVPLLTAAATWDESTGDLIVMCVNRSSTDKVRLDVPLRAFGTLRLVEATTLTSDDPGLTNTAASPDRVAPAPLPGAELEDGHLCAEIPPVSWNVLRLCGAAAPKPTSTSEQRSQ